MSLRRHLERLRVHAGRLIFDNSLRGMAHLGRLHPHARPHRHQVRVLRDVPYTPSGSAAHTLDIYLPLRHPERPGPGGPHPVVLYLHGGAFRILSKDSHWIMGLAFARRGYLVYNINYRLAPRHPYPAALEDACAALRFIGQNAALHGGDLSRLVLAGESAGANLALSLAVATSFRRPEPFAAALFDAGLRPRAVLPACGILQVSDPERFSRRRRLPGWIGDRVREVSEAYLGGPTPRQDAELADPLRVLEAAAEQGLRPERPLPACFAPVGTRDVLLDDTRRLKAALDKLGVPCEARYYPGEVHAFHAMVWRDNARRCWRDTYAFLERHLG